MQVFYPWGMPRTEPILGAVGELQFEVARYRLESEYNVEDARWTCWHIRWRFASTAIRAI